MCIRATEWIPPRTLFCCTQKQPPKRSKLRVHRLISRRKRRCEAVVVVEKVNGEDYMEMELKNLKLYMENMCILEENEQLRRKATLLRQENLALMSEFKNKFSHL